MLKSINQRNILVTLHHHTLKDIVECHQVKRWNVLWINFIDSTKNQVKNTNKSKQPMEFSNTQWSKRMARFSEVLITPDKIVWYIHLFKNTLDLSEVNYLRRLRQRKQVRNEMNDFFSMNFSLVRTQTQSKI